MKAKHEMLNMIQHILQNSGILTSFKIIGLDLNLNMTQHISQNAAILTSFKIMIFLT